ncbi:tripartite tricarboxylate transporter substrate binding protein [Pseudorhodoplanes sp.]|jgi:tripartite-type tricarboxylate transporter receptor subunit TctC|uniref:Bug family tripartite tricarboxylate transporter substrate binding protein n=1 Tax=Pseudorhodoplanes sp. TaxID=1934341 RepID=UPI002BF61493|nr:tripartite tricarboxylate transporter substrate binding protein [Pseudorhodoplanes sp.]HWV41349.1 tripartite tricarboxylate transporter substrate binding protein [Pseudorhodoplanes sp.]
MKFSPRRLLMAIAALLLIAPPLSSPASAQDWPNRPVTLVIPFAPGSASDVVGRVFAARLSEVLGQQVVVENMGGAGGTIGVGRVSKVTPDGYQFVMGGIDTFAMSKALYKKLPYDPVADFMPVALVAEQPIVLLTRKDLPVNDLKEFIAYGKANPGKLKYGSAGVGSASHLACAQLNAAAGIDAVHVPYRGSAPAVQDAIAGRLDFICALGAAAVPQIDSQTLKPLAALAKDRSVLLPQIPSTVEQGLTLEAPFWSAFFVPKGTPQEVIDKLQKATVAMIETPGLGDRLKKVGSAFVTKDRASTDYLKQFLDREIEKWGTTIKASGVSLD